MIAAVLLGPARGVRADAPPTPRVAPLTQAEAEALARDVSAKVEVIRGMKFKTPITVKIISGANARAEFKSEIDPHVQEDARHTQDAYIQMGLVPPGTDLVTGYLDLAEKGLAGYYKHGTNTFFLLDHVSRNEAKGVMAHELTHALEDQHYDLAALAKKAGDNADHATAITAIAEPSTTAVMAVAWSALSPAFLARAARS